MSYMTIIRKLHQLKNTPSDINEHLETLCLYASKCKHVTEFGVRGAVSTYALLAGNIQTLRSYDIHKHENVDEALKLGRQNGVDFMFFEKDVLKVEIEETDLLFIDTLHIYSQLKKEFELHSKKVRKYIVLHDTVTYGAKDEPTSWQTPAIMENYNIVEKRGLWPAIEEFLHENPEWSIDKHYTNNNGLLILEKDKNGLIV